MILRSIRLENVGQYGGHVELDLTPQRHRGRTRPIVLIGGKNGVGKTTLLESVRLALYGRRSLGPRVGQAEYDRYLLDHIHRPLGPMATPTGASVGLEFDYAESGIVRRYKVRRSWAARGRAVVESLVVEKDGHIIDDVPRDEWHHFLQELIPPGVSQLFFFDGEKIQEIADGHDDREQLANAFRGLLGIELVGRLRTDLGLYLARQQKDEADSTGARLESVLRDIAETEKSIADLSEEVATIKQEHDSQARAAEAARQRFVAEGGDLAARRSQIELTLQEAGRQIERRQGELRDLANGPLPLTVAHKTVKRFSDALRVAIKTQSSGISGAAAAIQPLLSSWKESDKPKRRGRWTPAHWNDLTRLLSSFASESSIAPTPSAFAEIDDWASVLTRLEHADNEVRPRVFRLAEELDGLQEQAKRVAGELSRADNNATDLLLDELRLSEQRLGATQERLRDREDTLLALKSQLTMLVRDRDHILEEQTTTASGVRRTALAARAASALADYERRLLTHKVTQLRQDFVRCFNRLARKGDLIADVKIDPQSFDVTLIGRNGHEVPKSRLSAGEKQIFAIAILWALARTSGRALPMIIDTPLARLDSDHRANLITRYFPAASHQVILLSTDTEVDANLASSLHENISHAYHLEFDAVLGCSTVQAGYFWDKLAGTETSRAIHQT